MQKNIFLLIILLTLPCLVFAVETDGSLNSKINKILANFDEDLNIGILVENVATGTVVYEKNARRYFIPASNLKLFTAFAALNYLGENFTYQTRLFADSSKIQQDTLNDNVYLQFSGDPSLTLSQLDHLLDTLAQTGIKRINGSFIVDDTFFDQNIMSLGTSWEDQNFCYGAPVSTLMIDHNCVSASLSPASKAEQLAFLTLSSPLQYMQFVNQVITQAATTNACTTDIKTGNANTYIIQGCIKTNEPRKAFTMAINNPRAYFRFVLNYLLIKKNISLQGGVRFEKINTFPKELASESSPPLKILVKTMLKESDNLIANSLFKTIGAHYFQDQGTWQHGSDALQDILINNLAVDPGKIKIMDGAGLSRYNHVTPDHIISLLRKVYSSTDGAIFIAALPISGVDGTLKDRLQNPITLGKIRAKTGTETSVSALSGYLETSNHQTLAFAILINGFIDSPLKYQTLENQICTALIETG